MRDEINKTLANNEDNKLSCAMEAWTQKKDQFLDHSIEVPNRRRDEMEEQWQAECARAFLPAEEHWERICCTCGNPVHKSEDGICFSPHAAAVADAVTRTAFITDTDNSLN